MRGDLQLGVKLCVFAPKSSIFAAISGQIWPGIFARISGSDFGISAADFGPDFGPDFAEISTTKNKTDEPKTSICDIFVKNAKLAFSEPGLLSPLKPTAGGWI